MISSTEEQFAVDQRVEKWFKIDIISITEQKYRFHFFHLDIEVFSFKHFGNSTYSNRLYDCMVIERFLRREIELTELQT